jgi:hypothetical protein
MTQLRKEYTMFKTTLIAAAALAAVTAGMAAPAQAKVNIDVHLGAPGLYVGHGYYPGYYPVDYYGGDCFYKKVKKVKWHDHGGFMHKHVTFKKKLVCY